MNKNGLHVIVIPVTDVNGEVIALRGIRKMYQKRKSLLKS
jgi:hypothetical protein